MGVSAVTILRNDHMVRDPGVLVADGDREKFKEPLGGFWSDLGNDRWNLE
jgi:hypothetical protein